jgi:hypothetical protein
MLPEKTLIEAWHGPDSTAAIAADLGVRGSELDLAFRQLKREGKIPKQSRQAPASNDRPAADEDGSAALLEALIRAHGADGRADIYPGSERKRR